MQQIQHSYPGETFRNHMRKNTAPAARIHRRQQRRNIIQLRERIDGNKDIGNLEHLPIPEEHPSSNAHVAEHVEGHVLDHLVGVGDGVLGRHVDFVEPGELEELLGEEEGADEVGLGAEEGEVGVVDFFHCWAGEDAVLLRGEVVDEGGRGYVAGGREGNAHGGH